MSIDEVPSEAKLPTKYGDFVIRVFHESETGLDHVALTLGEMSGPDPVLIRVHSECFTGDVLHSMRCDCGEQLDLAMERIAKEGKGIIVYSRQEGRGIGLVNKLKAYNLQDDGLDTVEANVALGFSAELRNYENAAKILKNLGVKKIELMTNNPSKVEDLSKEGFDVIKTKHLPEPNKENIEYLKTKAEKMRHQFTID